MTESEMMTKLNQKKTEWDRNRLYTISYKTQVQRQKINGTAIIIKKVEWWWKKTREFSLSKWKKLVYVLDADSARQNWKFLFRSRRSEIMRRNKKQRRKRIYEMKNSEKKTAQNEQHTARYTAAVMINEIKWRWWWTERVTRTETTIIITTAATAAAVAAVTNWIKKSSCLNRVSKEIRIRIRIKSIYDETTCFLSMYLIKKEINKQKATTNKFRLQSVCDRFFVVQQVHKMYSVICTHDSFIFTQ